MHHPCMARHLLIEEVSLDVAAYVAGQPACTYPPLLLASVYVQFFSTQRQAFGTLLYASLTVEYTTLHALHPRSLLQQIDPCQ